MPFPWNARDFVFSPTPAAAPKRELRELPMNELENRITAEAFRWMANEGHLNGSRPSERLKATIVERYDAAPGRPLSLAEVKELCEQQQTARDKQRRRHAEVAMPLNEVMRNKSKGY